MPAGQGKDAELFAAAVEHGAPPGYPRGSELARDLEIVAMLRVRGEAFAPRPDEKARAKQRLMALLAEQGSGPAGPSRGGPASGSGHVPVPSTPGDDAGDPVATARLRPVGPAPASDPEGSEEAPATHHGARPGRRSGRHTLPSGVSSRPVARPRGSRRPGRAGLRRAVLVGAAALAVVAALGGAGVLVSGDALPGESLYALKRVSESAGLALTLDDEARARRHLAAASTRIDEMEQLVARSPDSRAEPELFTSGLREFDAAAGEGSRMLLASHERGSTAAEEELRTWAADQAQRLSDLRPALPVPAAPEADGALELLDRLSGGTAPLEGLPLCAEGTGSTDPGTCAPSDPTRTIPDIARTGAEQVPAPEVEPQDGAGGSVPSAPAPPAERTRTPAESPAPGLLPEVVPELPLGTGPSSGGEQRPAPTTTTAPRSSSGGGEPPPLLPPVEVPPLVPGLPGVSLG